MKNAKKKSLFLQIIILGILLVPMFLLAQQGKNSKPFAWKFKTENAIHSSPAIKSDTLFIGSLDGTFYAINANNGSKLWEYKLQGEVRSTAAIGKDRVFFESENTLFALNFNGELQWKADLYKKSVLNQIDPWDFFHSSPVIFKDAVYIGTEAGLVLGYNLLDGEKVFQCQTENKHTIRTTPTISNDKIFFGDWEGVMYAYNINNAKMLWEYDTKQDTIYSWKNSFQVAPVVYNQSLFFAGRSSRMYSLDAATGKKNWSYASPTDQWLLGGIKVENGAVYIGTSDQHLFYSFDATTGNINWKTKLDCRIWGKPCIHKNHIYVGSISFYKIEKESGEIKWSHQFDKLHEDVYYGEYVDRRANIHSSPIFYNNKVIFGSDDGYIYALDVLKH